MSRLADNLREAWLRGDFQQIADAIDTGSGDHAVSRAIVLFNTSDAQLSGVVCLRVDMPWKCGRELPPLHVEHLETKTTVGHEVENLVIDDPGGNESHGRIRFDLLFAAIPIESLSWDTYVVEYRPIDVVAADFPASTRMDEACYCIVETARHPGTISPRRRPSELI